MLCFVGGTTRALTVAASSHEEKERWKKDLLEAIQQARDKTDTKITYLSLKSCSKKYLVAIYKLKNSIIIIYIIHTSHILYKYKCLTKMLTLHINNKHKFHKNKHMI